MKRLYKGIIAAAAVLALCTTLAVAGCKDDSQKDQPAEPVPAPEPVVNYTVTFVMSDTESKTQAVASGNSVSAPDDPERAGYAFTGWFADAANLTPFDFSAKITADTTVYAGWTAVREGYVLVSYMWNIDNMGLYKAVEVEEGSRITSLESPTLEGYRFMGWYKDADCTQQYTVGSSRVEENMKLYALWYKGYTFEAEYTNLEDEDDEPRDFYGYSNNLQGDQAVLADNTASNGYYIAGMYLTGSYLYFDIESDKAVTDAVLVMSFGFESGFSTAAGNCYDGDSIGTVTVSDTQYLISVNGTNLDYGTLSFNVSSIKFGEHTAFSNYTITTKLALNKGLNTIKLTVNNDHKGEGGTQNAKAPLVDAMTIYTGATLTWSPVLGNVKA